MSEELETSNYSAKVGKALMTLRNYAFSDVSLEGYDVMDDTYHGLDHTGDLIISQDTAMLPPSDKMKILEATAILLGLVVIATTDTN